VLRTRSRPAARTCHGRRFRGERRRDLPSCFTTAFASAAAWADQSGGRVARIPKISGRLVHHCTYEGDNRNLVLRSLITLKALTYGPTRHRRGADHLAAGEARGREKLDYRFCCCVDATFTPAGADEQRYTEEASACTTGCCALWPGSPEHQVAAGVRRRVPIRTGCAAFRSRQPARFHSKEPPLAMMP